MIKKGFLVLSSGLIIILLLAGHSSLVFAAGAKTEPSLNVIFQDITGHKKNKTERVKEKNKEETKSELCQRLAFRIQTLKSTVRDNHNQVDIKQLISDAAGLNFTTQVYLSLKCDPIQILSPTYDHNYKL